MCVEDISIGSTLSHTFLACSLSIHTSIYIHTFILLDNIIYII